MALPAQPASTVVLVRSAPAPFEVFLVRRHDGIAFMGGAHVFPGGRVETLDGGAGVERWCDGVERARTRLPGRSAVESVAFHVAAIRELFEEAGVLLARDASGELVSIHADVRARFERDRRALIDGALTLPALIERERLRLALDRLSAFAHWVTPEIEVKRFDTYFFLAIAPDGQDAAHDEGETTAGVWLTPEEATSRSLHGDIALPPPTWTTLRSLSACGNVSEAWEWAEAQPVATVRPRVNTLEDGTREILLPGDARMPAVEGFAAADTRFLLKHGRWEPAAR
jgi:8-oxo-dGTP pyrophosphatase MutT (NUDIX family)